MPLVRPQNLNDVFLAAATQTRQKPRDLTHNQKVRVGVVKIIKLFVSFFHASVHFIRMDVGK
jgi:hypothetical protein